MRRNLTKERVIELYGLFGGVSRHVFGSDTAILSAKESQSAAVNDLAESQVKTNMWNTVYSTEPPSVLMGYNASSDFTEGIPVFISKAAEEKVTTKYVGTL